MKGDELFLSQDEIYFDIFMQTTEWDNFILKKNKTFSYFIFACCIF